MSFSDVRGTRGARQPSGPVLRLVNRLSVRRLRRARDGRMMGMDALVLTTVGRTSGEPRSTPVAWFPDGDAWVVVASAAGAPANPAWYRNLAAHPDRVTIEVGGETVPVVAEELHGAERDAMWRRVVAAAPRFAGYETKTDRLLPVVRLTRRG